MKQFYVINKATGQKQGVVSEEVMNDMLEFPHNKAAFRFVEVIEPASEKTQTKQTSKAEAKAESSAKKANKD